MVATLVALVALVVSHIIAGEGGQLAVLGLAALQRRHRIWVVQRAVLGNMRPPLQEARAALGFDITIRKGCW